jgi:hypothetical protein
VGDLTVGGEGGDVHVREPQLLHVLTYLRGVLAEHVRQIRQAGGHGGDAFDAFVELPYEFTLKLIDDQAGAGEQRRDQQRESDRQQSAAQRQAPAGAGVGAVHCGGLRSTYPVPRTVWINLGSLASSLRRR